MNFQNKFTKIVFLTIFFLLISGLVMYQTGYASDMKETKKENTEPVTDCFESMEGYTSVERTEDAVPEYGHPNVKCSPKTGGVLWYGDPYDGTQPMGDMPELNDDTRGDYASEEAVVKPRESRLDMFECTECHDGDSIEVPADNKPRELDAHDDIVEDSLNMMHGRGAIWCLECHSATNRNKLIDHQGNEISFDQPQKLCGSCHGEVYADWRMGIHGKRTGSWAKGGKKRWWLCTECHNSHNVQVHRFDPLKPEPAPALPRGMKNADHERGGHGSHETASEEH